MINVHVCDTSSNEGVIAFNNLKRIKFGHVITFAPMSNGVTRESRRPEAILRVHAVVADALGSNPFHD